MGKPSFFRRSSRAGGEPASFRIRLLEAHWPAAEAIAPAINGAVMTQINEKDVAGRVFPLDANPPRESQCYGRLAGLVRSSDGRRKVVCKTTGTTLQLAIYDRNGQ